MQVPDAGADVRWQQFGIVEGERGREGEEAVGTWLAYAVFYSGVGAWGVAASYLVGLKWARKAQANSTSLFYCFFFLYFPFFIVL